MRPAIAGDADARLTCGDVCAAFMPFGGFEGRDGADSMVAPRMGS